MLVTALTEKFLAVQKTNFNIMLVFVWAYVVYEVEIWRFSYRSDYNHIMVYTHSQSSI